MRLNGNSVRGGEEVQILDIFHLSGKIEEELNHKLREGKARIMGGLGFQT